MNEDIIGRVIRTPQRNAYIVEDFRKAPCEVGREYIIRVGPLVGPLIEPHANGGPGADSSNELFSLTFYVRFEDQPHVAALDKRHHPHRSRDLIATGRSAGDIYIKPRTPHLNGKVERSHRIDEEEFYRLLEGVVIEDVGGFNAKL